MRIFINGGKIFFQTGFTVHIFMHILSLYHKLVEYKIF